MSQTSSSSYYLPDPSHWPVIGSVSLFLVFGGAAVALNGGAGGGAATLLGLALFVYMLFGWFGTVIRESIAGLYNQQVDISFRWGMLWFIVSEVMFFAAFFGVLFYARLLSVPWLGGEGTGLITHQVLWPEFDAIWPLLQPPSAEGFRVPTGIIGWQGLPLLNTVILVSSSITLTAAHWALKNNQRRALNVWLFVTVALGALFLIFQAMEYLHGYQDLNFTLNSGIYGTVFYMLTGFHGLHVTLGATILLVIWLRCLRGHFSSEQHFGFEAASWYWHFVDVVWLCLFFLVYVL